MYGVRRLTEVSSIEGRCLCGGVRFRVRGRTSGIVECHCSMCRKAAGGAFGAFFLARRSDVEWEGETLLARYESSPGLVRTFCSRCGTAITGANAAPPDDTIILAANALEGDPGLVVIAHEQVASRAPWRDGEDHAPRFDGAFPGWDPG